MESVTNSSSWIAVTFSPDTLVTSLSPGVESFAGHCGHEIVGRSITQFFADRTVFEMPSILETVEDEGRWEGEIDFRDRSRKTIKAYGIIMPLSDSKSRSSGFLMLSRLADARKTGDVSGSIYSEVGGRVRALVHDLNNPLAVIMGSTQLMALNSGCTGKVRSDIEKLYSELEKVAQVVEKLHGYALSLCERTSSPRNDRNSIQNSA